MSDQAVFKLVVLWEQELRELADATRSLTSLMQRTDRTDAEDSSVAHAIKRLHDSAFVALHGMWEMPDAHVLVCSADRMKFVPRDIKIERKRKKPTAGGDT